MVQKSKVIKGKKTKKGKKAKKSKTAKMIAMALMPILAVGSLARAVEPHLGLQATQRTVQARAGLDIGPKSTAGIAIETASSLDWWRWDGIDYVAAGPYLQIQPLRPIEWLEAQPYAEIAWPISFSQAKGSSLQIGVGLIWDITKRLAAVIGYRRSTLFGGLVDVLGDDRDDLVVGLDWRF